MSSTNPRKTSPGLQQEFQRRLSSRAHAQATETVVIPAGVAGTLVNFHLSNAPISNTAGVDTGGAGDTSLVLTSTTFLKEVSTNTEDVELANGDYYVDYLTGQSRGRKADAATSMTAVYSAFVALIPGLNVAPWNHLAVSFNGGTFTETFTFQMNAVTVNVVTVVYTDGSKSQLVTVDIV